MDSEDVVGVRMFNGVRPRLAEGVFVDDSALVIGDVTLGRDVSIWPMTVLRGDVDWQAIRASALERQRAMFSDRSMAAGVAAVYREIV